MLLKKYTVQDIHDDFDAAQDRLLQEAKSILQTIESSSQIGIANRLSALGFTSAELVQKTKGLRGQIEKSKELAQLIQYYSHNYPFQKFITESELDRICNKYNLIYAPVSKYKKDVPEKNLKEIERASPLHHSDRPSSSIILRVTCRLYGASKEERNLIRNIGIPVSRASIGAEEAFKENGLGHISSMYSVISNVVTTVNKGGLFIAAPKSYFNLKGLKKFGLFGFMEAQTVKDPIVFRYCRGGLQILSKWGLEASDESLLNEKSN